MSSMTSHQPRRTWGSIITGAPVILAGYVVLGLSVVAPPFIVGSVLVRPELTTLLCGILLVLLVAMRRLRTGVTKQPRSRLLSATLTVAVALIAVRGLLGLGTTYSMLAPASPTGCRVVVAESGFMMAGRGHLGAVGVIGFAWPQSDYTADDGGRPITAGSYTIKWSNQGAFVELTGPPGAPVWPTGHEVSC